MKHFRRLIELVAVFGGSVLACWWIAHSYGYLLEMTTNADSLTVLDFTRDLLNGERLDGWNLPRAPYLFPDALIASLVILFGWSNDFTMIAIAAINYSILIVTCHAVLRTAYGLERASLPVVGVAVTISLVAIMLLFPVSVYSVYWQIFASGTHFGAAVVVAWLLSLNRSESNSSGGVVKTILVFLVIAAVVASNTIALLLLMFWLASETVSMAWKDRQARIHMAVVVCAAIVGVGLSALIPRQSLAESFMSVDKLTNGLRLYYEWFIASFGNAAFILTLVVSTVAFPFLMQGRWAKFRDKPGRSFPGNNFVWPSLGVIAVSPVLFADAGSLRYMILPALILILCSVLLYFRLIGFVKDQRVRAAIFLAWPVALCMGAFLSYDKVNAAVAYQSKAAKGYQCIAGTAQKYPLQDGISSYWNARPIRFYSNFDYYLAQVTPWGPGDGYFFWGNNAYSLIYEDTSRKLPRHYNYIIAANDEVQSGLWGNITNTATKIVPCENNTLFYYDDPKALWDFLFARGLPAGLEPTKLISGPIVCAANPALPPCTFTGGDAKLSTQAGVRVGGAIKANGQPGFLVFGPYMQLEPGSYRLVAKGSLSGPSNALGVIDVVADLGKSTLMVKPIVAGQSVAGEIVSVDFVVAQPVANAEFRINIPAQIAGSFTAYELTRMDQ